MADKAVLMELIDQAETLSANVGDNCVETVDKIQQVVSQISGYLSDNHLLDKKSLIEICELINSANRALATIAEDKGCDTENLFRQIADSISAIKSIDGLISSASSTPQETPACYIEEEDISLMEDFITESAEHLEAAEAGLLELEGTPDSSESMNSVFRSFHTLKGLAGFLGLKEIGKLSHRAENLLDLVRNKQIELSTDIMNVIFESLDTLKEMISQVQQALTGTREVLPYENLSELLSKLDSCCNNQDETAAESNNSSEPVPNSQDSNNTTQPQDSTDNTDNTDSNQDITLFPPQQQSCQTADCPETSAEASQAEKATSEKIISDNSNQQSKPTAKQPARKPDADEKVKVSASRLDKLINMVGELVISHSMIEQVLASYSENFDPDMMKTTSQQGKIVREIQELSMMMRMVPINGVFQKMSRLVRDLSQKSGKKIKFVTSGEETELDRILVEQIADPLVHMIRNSVDHGIEDPATRLASSKPETGTVTLRAFHKGGNVIIQIQDDGKGLDKERILNKAKEKNIIDANADLADSEIYKLIFHAGFSTAEQVTAISGRGVGMDVVKRNIEALRGTIDIDSHKGSGTTFTITLPLTMAVIDGQIICVGSEKYIIPITSIVSCIRPDADDISTVNNRGEMIKTHGQLLPLIRLYEIFNIDTNIVNPQDAIIVIAEINGKRYGILADDLLEQKQVVIKNLGQTLGQIKGISGGAIMGDGKVSLILDMAELMTLAKQHQPSKKASPASELTLA